MMKNIRASFAPAQSLAWRRAGTELRQGSANRHKRFAPRFAAAEVDNEHDADDADVELHQEAGVVLIATKGSPVGIELRDDGLEGLAEPGDLVRRLLASPGLKGPEGDLILCGRELES